MTIYLPPRFLIALTLIAFPAANASGMIEVKLSIPKTYREMAPIVVGVIDMSRPQLNTYRVKIVDTLKPPGPTSAAMPAQPVIRVPADMNPFLADGQQVLILPSEKKGVKVVVLRIGERWMEGEPILNGPAGFNVLKAREDLDHSYPGPTSSVVELYHLLKDGKETGLLDKIDPSVLIGGIQPLGRLPVAGATAAVAGDFGDKKVSLAVTTSKGVQVFTFDGKGFSLSKQPAPAGFPAAPLKPTDAGKALSVATGDFGVRSDAASIVVREKGIFRESPDGKSPADDFHRLTGDAITTYPLGFDKGVSFAAATSIDANGDGKRDLVVLTNANGGSGVVLLNRGWGAFFVVNKLPELIGGGKDLPFKVAPGLLLAAADLDGDKREELVVIEPDGKIWLVANPAPKEQKD